MLLITFTTMSSYLNQNSQKNNYSYSRSLSTTDLTKIEQLKTKNNDGSYSCYSAGKGGFAVVNYITATNETVFPMLVSKSFTMTLKSIFSRKTQAQLEFTNNQKAEIESTLYDNYNIIYKYKGESLSKLLLNGIKTNSEYLDADKKLNITLQLLEEINKLHQKGLSHLDIKPDNILINGIGIISIIDYDNLQNNFELSAKDTYLTTQIGLTFNYLPPEMFIGIFNREPYHVISEKFDSWSLGVVIYELFTANRFMDEKIENALHHSMYTNSTELIKSYVEDKKSNLLLANNIPINIKNLLNKLLEVNPYERITIKESLEQYFVDEKTLANKSLFCLNLEYDKSIKQLEDLYRTLQPDNHVANKPIEKRIISIKTKLALIKAELDVR